MEVQNVSFLVAFLAGLLTFVSPCILPLVPIYLGFLGGKSAELHTNRITIFWHALFFVLGFSSLFVSLGASAGLIGYILLDRLSFLRIIAGVFLVILGGHLIGIIKIPILYRERRFDIVPKTKKGYLTSFLVGVSFSLGWIPCVGPVLGGILALASTSTTVLWGTLLLVVYSFGLTIPFLVSALFLSQITNFLRRLNRYHRLVEIISGLLLIFIGILVATNYLKILNF